MTEITNIASKCLKCKKPSCTLKCPLQIKIPEILSMIEKGEFHVASAVLFQYHAMPYLTSYLCDFQKQCYGNCLLTTTKKAVPFYQVERILTEQYLSDLMTYPEELTDVDVAIVGGGVTGLSIAHFLLREGLRPKIYEKSDQLGGVVMTLLPDFRYDKTIFKQHIEEIAKRVHVIKQNVGYEDSSNFFNQHQIIVFATGSEIARKSLKNEKVWLALDVLRKIATKELSFTNQKVIVIGGGNTACDVSRAVKRLGNDSTIVYRRDIASAPANQEELAKALDEGVKIKECLAPEDVIIENNQIIGLKAQMMELIDLNQQRKSIRETGKFIDLPCDIVIDSVGSMPDTLFLKQNGLNIFNEQGNIMPNQEGYYSDGHIYIGGDLLTGASNIASALNAGYHITQDIIKRKNELITNEK